MISLLVEHFASCIETGGGIDEKSVLNTLGSWHFLEQTNSGGCTSSIIVMYSMLSWKFVIESQIFRKLKIGVHVTESRTEV